MIAPPGIAPPGAAVERTRLSWRRTELTAAGVGLLAGTTVVRHPSPLAGAAVGVLALIWVGLLLSAQRRITVLSRPGEPPRVGRTIVVMALLVAGFAALGAILVLA